MGACHANTNENTTFRRRTSECKGAARGGWFKVQSESSAWSEEQLTGALADCVALGIRFLNQLTQNILRVGPQMLAVGAFCIGTNQVDLVE